MKREEDPGIAWIREVRHKVSADFDHDPKKLGDHLRELEKKYADRIGTLASCRRVSVART